MSLKVGDVPGARFGSPARTVNLGEHPSPPAHEVNLKPGWVDKAGIGRVFRDWVSSSLEVDQKFILAHQYGFLVNVLLRHLPDDAKVKVFDDLLSNTTGFLKWERRNGNAGITTAHPLFKSFTHPFLKPLAANVTIERGSVNPQVSMHEAIHFMQMRKLMPHNNLLTFLVGSLIEIESGKKGLTRKENDSGGGLLYPYYLNHPDVYFQMVLNGSVTGAYAGWVNNLSDSESNFLENEPLIIKEMAYYDEPRFPTLHGASNLYSVIGNFGRHRAERAAAVGLLSRNIDHAWTIVWLYSQGKGSFDEAEKEVVMSILSGVEQKYYQYPVVNFAIKKEQAV